MPVSYDMLKEHTICCAKNQMDSKTLTEMK